MPTDSDFAALEAGLVSNSCTPSLDDEGIVLACPRRVSWADARPVHGHELEAEAPLVMVCGQWLVPSALLRQGVEAVVVWEVDGHREERSVSWLIDAWDYRRRGIEVFDADDLPDEGDEGDATDDVGLSIGGVFTVDLGMLLRRPRQPTHLAVWATIGPWSSQRCSIDVS